MTTRFLLREGGMKFDEVLKDMADHLIEEATSAFDAQRDWHEFKAFSCERQSISAGGHIFRVKVEFEPDPLTALAMSVEKN